MVKIKRFMIFLLLSCGIHLLGGGYFLFFEKPQHPLSHSRSRDQIKFEILEAPQKRIEATEKAPSPRKSPVGKSHRNLHRSQKVQNLAAKLMTGLSHQSFEPSKQKASENPAERQVPMDFKDPTSFENAIANEAPFNEDHYFHAEIYRQIDSHLLYDTLLAQYKHRGWVYVKMDVDAEGRLIAESVQAGSEDPILKVHSLRAIRKALTTSLAENKRLQKAKSSTFSLRFFYGYNGQQSRCRIKDKGLLLTFCRFASEKVVSKNLTEHVFTGGIHVNPFLTVERWQQYKAARRRAAGELDPFADYRRDPDYTL